MVTKRKRNKYYTEVKRIIDGKVKQTSCCCASPGNSPQVCSDKSGNKTPCRCDCHRKKF